MYIYIDERTVLPYQKEVLKRFVGNKLVKVISNPTDEQLREFGYMEMVEGDMPEYNTETQYLKKKYTIKNSKIYLECDICDFTETAIDEYTQE